MTWVGGLPRTNRMNRMVDFALARSAVLRDYAAAITGTAGRLVFSLFYFVALANSLTIAEFGLFATASAAGVMLSRILGFGFISPLYRIATVKPLLLGVFTGGFILMSLLSLPVLAAASWITYAIFFSGQMALTSFALVIVAETLFWRPIEVTLIVNNGMNRFGRAATLAILATFLRAVAAVVFSFSAAPGLNEWLLFYLGANAVALLVAAIFFYPRRRIRFRMNLYFRRLPDAIYVAAADVVFYLQMELDKLLVLAIGGPQLAGIYAIIMRLVDLTAIPIRTFTMMLIQKMMRARDMLGSLKIRLGIEAGVFVISTLGLLGLAGLLYFFPNLLGRNVAEAAPLLILVLCVPGLRNLVEYQAELLFARGQTFLRSLNLTLLAGMKGLFLASLLFWSRDTSQMLVMLNLAFLALYLASAALTYSAMRLPAKRF
ncbi:lipopolysaccharide biosynthesis protein [Aquibium oceanicum]|uniref:Transporter n=1 Tax=Aquibium oceanicum TaxID=1670800 RepID=A0A1L3SVH5_9HYPH|nr:transporter [Aquibium oceanicum]